MLQSCLWSHFTKENRKGNLTCPKLFFLSQLGFSNHRWGLSHHLVIPSFAYPRSKAIQRLSKAIRRLSKGHPKTHTSNQVWAASHFLNSFPLQSGFPRQFGADSEQNDKIENVRNMVRLATFLIFRFFSLFCSKVAWGATLQRKTVREI